MVVFAAHQMANSSAPATIWHLRYLGESTKPRDVLITPDALKISNGSGNSLISKAPKWDVCIFNTDTKLIYHIPFATWRKSGIGLLESEVEPIDPDQKIAGIARVQGFPAIHYSKKTKVSDGFYRMRGKPRDASIDYYGTSAVPINDVQKQLLCLWFGVPVTKELPLIWVFCFSDGQKNYVMKFLLSYKEPYNKHAFDEPVNYKLAHDTRDVYMKKMSTFLRKEFEEAEGSK
jgi:hypothetical protein